MTERLSSYKNLHKRLLIQQQITHKARLKGSGFENLSILHAALRHTLKTLRLQKRGLKNVINFKVRERTVSLPSLSKAWYGKRILHLSDTHLDGIPGLTERLLQILPTLKYDMCFFTGDFRFGKGAYHPAQLAPTLKVLKLIKAPQGLYGILGNHDFIEQVESLESHGMKVLLNESVKLGDDLYLAGIDDPHLYQCDDLDAALHQVPPEATTILLAHSPERVKEAASKKVNFYLCGHTHGGQIRLPLVGPPFINSRCSRAFAHGEFSHKGMSGYTHNGTGASSVAARFYCPSEIVIHTLQG